MSEYKKWHKKEWGHLPSEKLYTELELEQAFNAGMQACAARKDKELAELEESRLALIKKIDSLSVHETCACSYDKEDDICLHHSPKLVEKDKEIAALRGFIESARENSEIYPFFDSQDFKELLEKHNLY